MAACFQTWQVSNIGQEDLPGFVIMSVILNNQHIDTNNNVLSLALYGYACFTALAVDNGKVKGLKYHMDRLLNDSREIFGMSPKEKDIKKNINTFLDAQAGAEHIIVRVTLFPDNFSLATPEKIYDLNIMVTGRAHRSLNGKPMRLSSVDTARILPFQKTANMIANLKARAAAHRNGFDDALMVNKNVITEGATWNIFFGVNKRLATPSLDSGILPGVTRRLLIDYGNDLGFSISEQRVSLDDLNKYAYCFATNAAIGIAPICSIDHNEYDANSDELAKLKEGYEQIPGEDV
ncbi:MAG: hypothetical protein GY862_24590 [Gammaproteobacteria bacterium]|nr:hypothetical protein [Gammaproteobacteria bacterium]